MTSVHRSLVLALGDAQCIAELGDGENLPPERWAAGLERVRVEKYGALDVDEGSRRVGFDMAHRLLHHGENKVLLESLRVLPMTRAFEVVVAPIGERLRKPLELDFAARSDVSGVVVVRGPMVLSPHVWRGFLEAVVAELSGSWAVTIAAQSHQQLELEISVSP